MRCHYQDAFETIKKQASLSSCSSSKSCHLQRRLSSFSSSSCPPHPFSSQVKCEVAWPFKGSGDLTKVLLCVSFSGSCDNGYWFGQWIHENRHSQAWSADGDCFECVRKWWQRQFHNDVCLFTRNIHFSSSSTFTQRITTKNGGRCRIPRLWTCLWYSSA